MAGAAAAAHAAATDPAAATAEHAVPELFAGVGGLHYALRRAGIPHRVCCAFDVDDAALRSYRHNLPGTPTSGADIVSLAASSLAAMRAARLERADGLDAVPERRRARLGRLRAARRLVLLHANRYEQRFAPSVGVPQELRRRRLRDLAWDALTSAALLE